MRTQFLCERGRQLGLPFSEILSLAQIIFQVEQFIAAGGVIVDELPLAVADCARSANSRAGDAPVIGEMPIQRSLWLERRLAAEERSKTDAVDHTANLLRLTDAAHLQSRWEKVLNYDGGAADRVGPGRSWPAHEHRHADASFVG